MPKDNEVDEKVIEPVAVIYPDTGLRNDAAAMALWRNHGYDTGGEPLYSAATVAELRAEVADRDAVIECKNIDIRERDRALHAASQRADAAERRVRELERLRAETYQVVSVLLSDTGQFDSDHDQKILDNLSEARIVHEDVLPWATLTGADPT